MAFHTEQISDGIDNSTIRVFDKATTRAWLEQQRQYLRGRVLDYGCGLQPYRDLVEGEYVGYDRKAFPGNVSKQDHGPSGSLRKEYWDTILCTQMLQYVPSPNPLLMAFRNALQLGGHLVMTYATNWAQVEPWDKWRFTRGGMEKMLSRTLFATQKWQIIEHDCKGEINLGGFRLPLGYGVVARAV